MSVLSARAADVLQTFFVPFPDNDVQTSLNVIDAYQGNVGNVIRSVISMVVGNDGTLIYYDQWEDGYEADLTDPAQATTQIWGDGDPDNGLPPGYTNDVLNAGAIINLETSIDVTRTALLVEYDGRDKIGATQPISMIRAQYPLLPGEYIAESGVALDISQHGTEYVSPVGVDMTLGSVTNESFEYTACYVMGDYDFTFVEVDRDNDGVYETTARLNQGDPLFINGGIRVGARVRSSKPVQCHFFVGDIYSNYESRWYTAWPLEAWSTDYFCPVGTRLGRSGTSYPTVAFFYNASNVPATIYYETTVSTGSFAIAANSLAAPFTLPTNSGGRFYTTNGHAFSASAIVDGSGNLQDYDWGFTLVPRDALTSLGICSWGPGQGVTGGGDTNGNPVWVTAVSNTTLYVDLDGNPDTGPLTNALGRSYDFSTNVVKYQSVTFVDNTDTNQSGLTVYTLDGTRLAAAWGEDPTRADTGLPYIDAGYEILPFPTILAKKFATLLIDNNSNGYADPGDTLQFLIDVINVGFGTANNVIFQDEPPTNLTTYATNSAVLAAGGTTNAVPDSLPPKLTRFPFDEGGYNIGTLAVGATSTVRYATEIVSAFPDGFNGYIHNNATIGGSNGNWETVGFTNVQMGGLAIAKTTSTTNLLAAGSNFTYTLYVENTGTFTYSGLTLEDPLPLGVSYVTNSALITYPYGLTNAVYDHFDTRSFANNDGSLTWLNSWQEQGESDGYNIGDVQVYVDPPYASYAMRVQGPANAVWRSANLSGHSSAFLSFTYRRYALDGASDYVDVFVSTNGWSSSNFIVRLQGAATDTSYLSANLEISTYVSTNTSVKFLSSATLAADEGVWFDDIKISAIGSNVTFAGSAPATLFENLSLPPGTGVTVRFTVQVDSPPTVTQIVNVASVRANQHEQPVFSPPVTNAVDARASLEIFKTNNPSGTVGATSNILYTLEIRNTGDIWQTNVRLEDLLPFGMTYVAGSANIWRPYLHTNVVRDLFGYKTYTNQDGNVNWAGAWTEVGDDGIATNGNIQLAVDNSVFPGHAYALRTAFTGAVYRAANLSGYTNATLLFDYRRTGLDAAGDAVLVSASSNNGTAFTQIGQVGGLTNDGDYMTASFNLTPYIATNTIIRFSGSATRDADDYIWLDDVRIAYSASNATNLLFGVPELFTGYALPPGTSLYVRLNATVNDPISATNFINAARTMSDQQTTWLTSRVTNASTASAGMRLTKATALATNWDYGVTNDYYLTIENTGTVALTGLKLTDVLPAGVTFVANSAAIVQFLAVTTNEFTETVSDGFGTAAYNNNDGTTNWLGGWDETGDNDVATTGNVLIRLAGGTNALVFENTAADNDYITRTNPLALTLPGRTYTNVTLSFSYRRQNWDAGDTLNAYVSTNNFAAQTQVFAVPTTAGTDAGYVPITTNVTTWMSANMALRLTAGANFALNDRINFDFVTFTNRGYDVSTNSVPDYSPNLTVSVVSNLTATPTNLLVNYVLPAGSSVSVRVSATLNVPLVATQFVNTATATNNQTPPASALVTNYSVANAVGDYVWSDVVADGAQSLVEPGIGNVVVKLYDSATNWVLTTTSGVDGAYAFTNLPSGSYFLEFVTPTNYLPTTPDQGGDDALDSDIATNTGRTVVFTLSGGTNDTTRDAGYYQPSSSLGDFVWRDVDGDGIQDGGAETGMPGVVVTLYDGASNVVNVTTTDVNGAYGFGSLNTGTFFLEFTPPTNFTFTLQDQGSDDAVDSDASPVTGRTAIFNLPPGVSDTSRDVGLSAVVYGLAITKTSDAGDCLAGGAAVTYTIVVQNTGTVAQSGIVVADVLPAGLTYVPGSASAAFFSPTGGIVSVTNNASTTFTVPAGIVSATVQAWGGGGGGAQRTSNGAGGGGGGGAYSRAVLAVLPGSNYTVTVGAAGAQNTTGGDSWFALGSVTGLLAKGGTGGTLNNANGAAGGVAANGIGDVVYNGGNGANGVTGTYGGGGGSSAGTNAAGTSATVAAGGVAPAGGGNGGAGKTAPQGAGTAGSAPGGGGGGALRTANNQNGGAGATGRVVVSYDTSAATSGTLGAPPSLWTGGILGTGASVTITFQAVVDSPSAVTQVLNVASTYSAVQPVRQASVTNCVQYADVGVRKTVTKTDPDQVEIVEYLLTATNNGPSVATGVQITDVLPSQVQYNSHSNGVYSEVTGIWNVGTLGVGAATTLYVNVTVREGTGGLQITNAAAITGRDLYDPNPTNDVTAVVIVPKGGATVGDRVWFDASRDGIQDSGETNFIANVPVSLMTTNGVEVTSTWTSAEGVYLFANVMPGTYYVRFDLTNVSTHITLAPANQGGDGALDSDAIGGGTRNFAWTTNFTVAGGQTNLNLDLGLMLVKGTRADLAEVWGEWKNGEGRIGWRTSAEWNTAGFTVYRVDPETGAETPLNEGLVPSAFDPAGAVYELADPAARAGGSGTYRLEELELSGGTMDLGTHAVAFAGEPAAAKAARAEVRTARTIRSAAAKAAPKAEGPSSVLKAFVRHEGLYGVDLQAIAAGMGRTLADVQALAADGRLSLDSQGSPVPTIYDAARGRLVFHGQGLRGRYARDNAYLISEGDGRTMPRRAPGATGGQTAFPATVRFEEDRNVFDSPTVPLEDFFYWDYVIAGTNATSLKDFPIDLTGAVGDVALKVRLMGWSSSATNDPDHRAEIRFNGTAVGTATFDGQESVEVEVSVPGSLVSNGVNALSVKGVLQAGVKSSAFVVDWIEAAFERELVPLSGTALFAANGASAVSAAAFAAPLAIALDRDGNPTWIADENGELPAKAWAASENERYAVVETESMPMLSPEPAAADAWFLSETNRIDYLVIASRALASAAQELADYRASQGLRVGVAVFEDVCDWMANGVRTPEAIPELLAYAEGFWAEAPWMVVLAGSGSYDYFGTLGGEVNHLPPMLVQTAEGLFAADELLADSGGDELPDVAIGRLPALTAEELTAMIAKIKAYEAGFGQNWQGQIVFAADTNDASAGQFAAANEELAALIDGKHSADVVDLNVTALTPARNKLLSYFQGGAGIIHYTGHGGVANWNAKGLLKAADVAAMNNANRPPVVAALSCLVGRYEAPGVNSLGELLMRKAGGGAAAVWGPSGLSRNDPAKELGEAFYRAVLQEGSGTLGLAVLRARRSLSADLFKQDTFGVYNLLGDPALRILNNDRGGRDASSFAEWRWERFQPAELADAETSGATDVNFRDYALDGGYDVEAELPEFGFAPPADDEDGFILRWKRRVHRADVEYYLFLSHDLTTWTENSSDLETVDVEADPDGVMETVRTRIKGTEAERTYLGVKAQKK